MKVISQFFNNLPSAKSEPGCDSKGAGIYISRKQTPERRGQCDIKVTDTGFIRDVIIPFF